MKKLNSVRSFAEILIKKNFFIFPHKITITKNGGAESFASPKQDDRIEAEIYTQEYLKNYRTTTRWQTV
jgi:hypothetical protein